jgi:hypothetical protein
VVEGNRQADWFHLGLLTDRGPDGAWAVRFYYVANCDIVEKAAQIILASTYSRSRVATPRGN